MARAETFPIVAEMVAQVLQVDVAEGQRLEAGTQVALLESMKMEIPVLTEQAGTVAEVRVRTGDVVSEGVVMLVLAP